VRQPTAPVVSAWLVLRLPVFLVHAITPAMLDVMPMETVTTLFLLPPMVMPAT